MQKLDADLEVSSDQKYPTTRRVGFLEQSLRDVCKVLADVDYDQDLSASTSLDLGPDEASLVSSTDLEGLPHTNSFDRIREITVLLAEQGDADFRSLDLMDEKLVEVVLKMLQRMRADVELRLRQASTTL